MMSKQNLAKDAAIVGVTQIVSSLGAFLLLSAIAKTVGPSGYGIWVEIMVTVTLLSPLALLGLPISLVRFFSSEKDVGQLREGFYSMFIVCLVSSIAISLLVIALSGVLAGTLFGDPSAAGLIALSSFLVVLAALEQLTLFYFRVTQRTKTFAILTIFKTLTQLGLTVVLLIAGLGVFGVVVAALIAGTSRVLIGQLVINSQIGFEIPKFSNLRSHLKFGMPLAPTPLIKWISDSSDRYLVGFFLGVAIVGIYSAGYAIGNLIVLLTASLQFILYPALVRLYDEGRLEDVQSYLSNALRLFLMIAIPAVFGLSVLAEPILRLVTNSEFTPGSVVVPFVAVSSLLAGVFQILINITYLADKTRLNAYILLASGIANIVINIILIPTIGMVGAAFSTLVSYIIMVLLTGILTARYIKFKVCWGFINKSVAASSIMALIIFWISPRGIIETGLVVAFGTVTYFALLALVKGISKKEVNLIRSIFS